MSTEDLSSRAYHLKLKRGHTRLLWVNLLTYKIVLSKVNDAFLRRYEWFVQN